MSQLVTKFYYIALAVSIFNSISCTRNNASSAGGEATFSAAVLAPKIESIQSREADSSNALLWIAINGKNLNADLLKAELEPLNGLNALRVSVQAEQISSDSVRLTVPSGSSLAKGLYRLIVSNAYGQDSALVTTLKGDTGAIGPLGPIGLTGPQGPIGLTGPQGPIGLTGPQGPIGLTGPQGAIGLTGPQGAIGLTGPQGPIGLTGPQGAIGLTGSQGAIGLTGATGATGLAGPQGPAGAMGVQGVKGDSGTPVFPKCPSLGSNYCFQFVVGPGGNVEYPVTFTTFVDSSLAISGGPIGNPVIDITDALVAIFPSNLKTIQILPHPSLTGKAFESYGTLYIKVNLDRFVSQMMATYGSNATIPSLNFNAPFSGNNPILFLTGESGGAYQQSISANNLTVVSYGLSGKPRLTMEKSHYHALGATALSYLKINEGSLNLRSNTNSTPLLTTSGLQLRASVVNEFCPQCIVQASYTEISDSKVHSKLLLLKATRFYADNSALKAVEFQGGYPDIRLTAVRNIASEPLSFILTYAPAITASCIGSSIYAGASKDTLAATFPPGDSRNRGCLFY